MKTSHCLVIAVFGIMCLNSLAVSAEPENIRDATVLPKKMLAWGHATGKLNNVEKFLPEIEKLPFDGLVLQGIGPGLGARAYGKTRYSWADFKPHVERIKRIPFKRLTDNFFRYSIGSGNVDWFDEDYDVVLHNAKLVARFTKQAGLKGLVFDTEDYTGKLFHYEKMKLAKTKSFEEYQAQARKRGRELMEALQSEYPDIILLYTYGIGYVSGNTLPYVKARDKGMIDSGWGLALAFLTGMLEAAGPDVRLVDGQEDAYHYRMPVDFYRGYHNIRSGALTVLPESLHEKYNRTVEAGVAMYPNDIYALRSPNMKRPRFFPWMLANYHLTLEEQNHIFEAVTFYSLQTADTYVWCYIENLSFWSNDYPESLPRGAVEAFVQARDQYDAGKKTLDWEWSYKLSERIARSKSVLSRIRGDNYYTVSPVFLPEIREATITMNPKASSIVVDGNLREAGWQKGRTLPQFLLPKRTEVTKKPPKTVAKVTYDETHLYIAVTCDDPDAASYKNAKAVEGEELLAGPWVQFAVCIPLFNDNPLARFPYHQFVVSPQNVQWTGKNSFPAEFKLWKSAVRIEKNKWIVEMAIPLDILVGYNVHFDKHYPLSLDTPIRVNLIRNYPNLKTITSWSQTLKGGMEPEHFGSWEMKK